MGKHAKATKFTIGGILFAALGFAGGQLAPPLLTKSVDELTARPQTKLKESTEEFSAFYARQLSWPYSPCQETVVTSASGLTPQEAFQPDNANMQDAILSGRVLPWGRGDLTILLSTTNPSDTITVFDIEAEVYEHRQVKPEWLVRDEPGDCGGAYQRSFSLQLEDGGASIVDKGILEGAGDQPEKIKDQSLQSQTWTVGQSDISEITISAEPLDGYYEFGINIHYMLNGEEFERQIGSPNQPYKVVGSSADIPKSYMFRSGIGLVAVDSQQVP